MSRVFLSHSGRDTAQAVALVRWLIEQEPSLAGEIFLDIDPVTGIGAGQRWKDALRVAAKRCEAVICLVSGNWLASPECRAEYRVAEYLGKRVFCARLEPCADTDPTLEWQRCELSGPGPEVLVDGVAFNLDGLRRLLSGLRAAGVDAEHFPWPPAADPGRAPYRGWDPFEPVDAAVYFGRDREIVGAMDELRTVRAAGTRSLFVIVGPSGTGKSSFLRAGLIPRLRRDDRHFVVLETVRPGREAITGTEGLAASIALTRQRFGLPGVLGEIKTVLTDGDSAFLRDRLAEIPAAAAGELSGGDDVPALVLPIDQAEELIAVNAGPEAALLLDLLGGLLRIPADARLPLIVALAIRTDRYESLLGTPQLSGMATRVFADLAPMPRDRFREVIVGPARRAGAAGHRLELAPALVDRLIADCADGAETLPLLALTLASMYRDYGANQQLTTRHYEAMGGVRTVVTTEVARLLAPDPVARRAELTLLRSAFVPWLATVDPKSGSPIRRIARWDELPVAVRPLIDRFVDRRLLVKDDRGSGTVVEVALESLLSQWDELAGWLREESDDLRTADGIERTADEWTRNDRDAAWLLTGTRLTDAETLTGRAGFRERLAPVQDYLAKSRRQENARVAAEQARQLAELHTARAHAEDLRRRARILVALALVAVLTATTAVVFYLRAESTRRDATTLARENLAARLVAEAQQQFTTRGLPGGERRAILDMIAAYRLSPATAGPAVIAAQYQTRYITKVFGVAGNPSVAATSSDGRWIATGAQFGPIQLWDALSGIGKTMPATDLGDSPLGLICSMGAAEKEILERFRPGASACPSWAMAIAISPDGRWVAASIADGTVLVWGTESGKVHRLRDAGSSGFTKVAISSDGSQVATINQTDTVRVWDVGSGAVRATATVGPLLVAVAISATGHTVAAVTGDGRIRLWDTASGAIRSMPGAGNRPDWATAISADGRWVAAGGVGGIVRVWDTVTDTVRTMPSTRTHQILAVALTPAGAQVVGGDSDGAVQVWDTGSDAVRVMPGAGKDSVHTVAISADGRRVSASSGSDARVARLWDIESARQRTVPNVEGSPVWQVAADPKGRWVATGDESGRGVQLWDAASGRIRTMPGQVPAGSIAVSDDGGRVAIGDRDGRAHLWDPFADTVVRLWNPNSSTTPAVAVSPDGRWVVTGHSGGAVHLWDTESGTDRVLPAYDGIVEKVAVSADGRWVVSAYYSGAVHLTDVESRVVEKMPDAQNRRPSALAISADNRFVAVADYSGSVWVWDVTSGAIRAMPNPGQQPVMAIAISADGRWVVAGDDSGMVYFWSTDERHGAAVPVAQYAEAIGSLAFDGQRSITIVTKRGAVADIRFPAADPEPLCAKLISDIQRSEWNLWVSPDTTPVSVCAGSKSPP